MPKMANIRTHIHQYITYLKLMITCKVKEREKTQNNRINSNNLSEYLNIFTSKKEIYITG